MSSSQSQKATTQAFDDALGPPRESLDRFDLHHSDEDIRQESKRCADIAASVQLVLEETVIKSMEVIKGNVKIITRG